MKLRIWPAFDSFVRGFPVVGVQKISVFVVNLIVSGKIAIIAGDPKRVLFVLILKRKIGDQKFPSGDQKVWFVFRCEGKILLTLFGDHIFPCGD